MQIVIGDNIEASFPFVLNASRSILLDLSLQGFPFFRVKKLAVAGVQLFLGCSIHIERVDFLLEFLQFFKVEVVKEHRLGLRALHEGAIVVAHLTDLVALADLGPHTLLLRALREVKASRFIPTKNLLHRWLTAPLFRLDSVQFRLWLHGPEELYLRGCEWVRYHLLYNTNF